MLVSKHHVSQKIRNCLFTFHFDEKLTVLPLEGIDDFNLKPLI